MLFTGVLLAVCGGLCWTAFGYIMGKAPKQGVNVTHILLLYNFFVVLAGLGIGVSASGCPAISVLTAVLLLVVFLGGIVNYVQLELLSRAMQCGPNGIIWSICQAGFVGPFCMGILFFHVPLNPVRLTGILAILLALALLGIGRSGGKKYGRWHLPAFGAFLSTVLLQSFANLPSYFAEGAAIPSIWRQLVCSAGMGAGALLFLAGTKRLKMTDVRAGLRSRFLLIYAGILLVLVLCNGNFFIYPSMDILARAGAGAIAYPIMVASCIVAFELYSIIFLHEKRSPAQIAGTVLCIAGAVAITC